MLNNTQREVLNAALDYLFEAIVECGSVKIASTALQAIRDDVIYEQHKAAFTQQQILDVIDELRRIYQHPCPQNRLTSNPYLGQEEGMAVWRDPLTHAVCREPLGILSLTAQNDKTAAAVTKVDVIKHFEIMIEHYQLQIQTKHIETLQTQVNQLQAASAASSSAATISNADSTAEFFALSNEQLLAKAQTHINQRQHFEALAYLNQLVNKEPNNSEHRYLRAKSLIRLNRRPEALTDLNIAIRYRSNHAQSWVERGFTLENLGDLKGALRDYSKALTLNPQQHFALSQRGGVNMQLGNFDQGRQDYETSLEIKDDDANTYRNRAEQLLALGDYSDAIADIDEAIQLQPTWKDLQALKVEAEKLRHANMVRLDF